MDQTKVIEAMAVQLCETRNAVLDMAPHPRACNHCTAQAALLVGRGLELVRMRVQMAHGNGIKAGRVLYERLPQLAR